MRSNAPWVSAIFRISSVGKSPISALLRERISKRGRGEGRQGAETDRRIPPLAWLNAGDMGKKKAISQQSQVWIEARRRHRLSHAHVQMARELGLNPKKLGKIDNHRQEPWKLPLPEFIEHLYFKRFGGRGPS